MKIAELGEDRLVAVLTQDLPLGPQVRVGAGDDCAVHRRSLATAVWQLLKTDVVIEGVHFEPGEKMRARRLEGALPER